MSAERYTPLALLDMKKDDTLISRTTCYMIVDFNSEGAFGKVAKCITLSTQKCVAVKILKGRNSVIQQELNMLQKIRCLNPEKTNIVKFMEHFMFKNVSCLAFEMLDRSLLDLMKERRWIPFNLNEIRPITHQLVVAFAALKSIGILHTDLQPNNVMLVNHKEKPFRIKLIDFGVARPVNKVCLGMKLQPGSFRAPEVTLGLPLTEAIDMWGVGCMMAFLYFAGEIFPGKCSYNMISTIVHLLGLPEYHILRAGIFTKDFFNLCLDPHSPGWRLKTPDEYEKKTGNKPQMPSSQLSVFRNLEHAVQAYPDKKNDTEYDDRMEFLSLLKSTLDLNPKRRVTPSKSLKKNFLTMVHLKNKRGTSSYVDDALRYMTSLGLCHLEPEPKPESDNTVISVQEADIIIHDDNSGGANDTNNSKPNEPSLHFDEGGSDNRPSIPGVLGDLPQVDDQGLQVAHNTDELQAENRNKVLQEELEQLRLLFQLLNARYDNDIPKMKEQADALLHDLEIKILQKDRLHFETAAALQEQTEKNKNLRDQVDNMAASLHEVNLKYQIDVTEVRQQADNLRFDLERELEQKKFLQTKYEQLLAELHAVKERNKTLKQDLDKIHALQCNISQTQTITQKPDTLQHELGVDDKEIKSHADSESEGCCALKAEQEAPRQMMAEEMTVLKEKEEIFGRELDELQSQLNAQLSLNLKLSTELKAEREAPLKITIPNAEPFELTKEAECPEEMPCEQQETISPAPALKPPKEAEVAEEKQCEQETISPAPALESQRGAEGNLPNSTAEPPSVWKRVRHFLGLRKPKKWKKKKEEGQN